MEAAKAHAQSFTRDELFMSELASALEESLAHTLPGGFSLSSIPHLDPPSEVSVEDAVGLEPRTVEVRLSLRCEVHAHGYANKGDSFILADEPGFSIDDWDWNEWTASMEFVDEATVEVTVIVDMRGPHVTGFQVDNVAWDRMHDG